MAGHLIRQYRQREALSCAAFAQLVSARIAPASVTRQAVLAWENEGKVARPDVQRAIIAMGVCAAGDWLLAAPGPTADPA